MACSWVYVRDCIGLAFIGLIGYLFAVVVLAATTFRRDQARQRPASRGQLQRFRARTPRGVVVLGLILLVIATLLLLPGRADQHRRIPLRPRRRVPDRGTGRRAATANSVPRSRRSRSLGFWRSWCRAPGHPPGP